jgi:hypothetical protein
MGRLDLEWIENVRASGFDRAGIADCYVHPVDTDFLTFTAVNVMENF